MNLEGLGELANTLTEDAMQAMKELKANNDQFHRRSFIRCYFSFVESYSFIMWQVLITLFLYEDGTGVAQQPLDRITLHKLSLLFEESPILKENGKLKLQQQKISLINQLAFTIKLYKDEFKLPNDFIGDNGWKEFQDAVKIRN